MKWCRKTSGRGGPGHAGTIAHVVDPSRRRAQLVGRLRVEGQGVEQVDVPRPLGVDQLADAEGRATLLARSARLRTAWSPKTASSSFCPSTAEPPAMPTSAPVSPAVWENTTTISATDSPLTP